MTRTKKPPTLADLRRLAKRKGYPLVERLTCALHAMPHFSQELERAPYIEMRFHADHEATARKVFAAALSALPDASRHE